jgi:hypothetical protein
MAGMSSSSGKVHLEIVQLVSNIEERIVDTAASLLLQQLQLQEEAPTAQHAEISLPLFGGLIEHEKRKGEQTAGKCW